MSDICGSVKSRGGCRFKAKRGRPLPDSRKPGRRLQADRRRGLCPRRWRRAARLCGTRPSPAGGWQADRRRGLCPRRWCRAARSCGTRPSPAGGWQADRRRGLCPRRWRDRFAIEGRSGTPGQARGDVAGGQPPWNEVDSNRTGAPCALPTSSASHIAVRPRTIVPTGRPVSVSPVNGDQPAREASHDSSTVQRRFRSTTVKSAS